MKSEAIRDEGDLYPRRSSTLRHNPCPDDQAKRYSDDSLESSDANFERTCPRGLRLGQFYQCRQSPKKTNWAHRASTLIFEKPKARSSEISTYHFDPWKEKNVRSKEHCGEGTYIASPSQPHAS